MAMWKKCSFLIILIVCGVCVLGLTNSWEELGQSGRRIGAGLLAAGTVGVVKGNEDEIEDEGELARNESMANKNEKIDGEDAINNWRQDDDKQTDSGGASDKQESDRSPAMPGSDRPVMVPESDRPVTYRDPSEVVYAAVEEDYFADAVFIGDSRTVGLMEYGGLEDVASFYASTGLTIFKLLDSRIVEIPGRKEKMTVEQALSERQFGKIYLMLGINEMGRGKPEDFLTQYSEVITRLRQLQPDAVIYLQSIMRVTEKRSAKGDYITNEGIDERNAGISALADNVKVYYLDVNPVICDEGGAMNPAYTTDGVHLKARYIPLWKDFLKQHAVVLD